MNIKTGRWSDIELNVPSFKLRYLFTLLKK